MSASRVSAVRVESNQDLRTIVPAASAMSATWLGRLLATDASWPLAVIRVVLAVVMFAHGAQKALGLFGGYGFAGTMSFFTDTMGIPYVFGLLAILAEFAGSLALLVGFTGRVAAAGVGVIMAVAVVTVHASNGFFMNWYGQQAGEGYEYHLLAGAMALAIVIGGSGIASLDRVLVRRLRGR
jgi:putative oxidoreductase